MLGIKGKKHNDNESDPNVTMLFNCLSSPLPALMVHKTQKTISYVAAPEVIHLSSQSIHHAIICLVSIEMITQFVSLMK